MKSYLSLITIVLLAMTSCEKDDPATSSEITEWVRTGDPILRDTIIGANYEAASDAHVFVADGNLSMIYSGDFNDISSIKLALPDASGHWSPNTTLLGELGPSGKDLYKETAFYHKAANGKHQIYYIGYNEETAYEAQVFMAEADELTGPYTQMDAPIVPKGMIAGKNVYCITSPSVVAHDDKLYMAFLGWNDAPASVTEVWAIGAISEDNGQTWNDFQLVDTRIGMEGQVTKVRENEFIAVRTGPFQDKEAIYYATAAHPFGPWTELPDPILIQGGPPHEIDEIIAPQIFIDPGSNEEVLYYTGAEYVTGWWIMKAKKP